MQKSVSLSCHFVLVHRPLHRNSRHSYTQNTFQDVSMDTTLLIDCQNSLQSWNCRVWSILPMHTVFAGYEPNLTNSQSMVAWAQSQKPNCAQAGCGPILSGNAHNYLKILEQSRIALNLPHAGFKRAKNMSKQLMMKFMLQEHKLPTCLERKFKK